jgi:hypothetical protein
MKYVKSFEKYEPREYNDAFLGDPYKYTNIKKGENKQHYIEMASKILNKELTEKDVILELRDNIEISLQKGDDDMADVLTDIKFELETLLK